jgi:glycosyltransferase involved in cell wall biosynthesis
MSLSMNVKNFDFTVVTPSYNQGQFLTDCLASVKMQKNVLVEHIVVDNCSNDSSTKILASWKSKKNYSFEYISELDSGPANAINKGFNKARGKYICWLNSDDFYLEDNILLEIKKTFEKFSKVGVITGDGYYTTVDGILDKPIFMESAWFATEKALKRRSVLLQPSTFWRSTVNCKLNENLGYCFDWDLWLRLKKNGVPFYYQRSYLSGYRVHGTSLTVQDTFKRKKEVVGIILTEKNPLLMKCLALLILSMFWISELVHMPKIKLLANAFNNAISLMTGGRISIS